MSQVRTPPYLYQQQADAVLNQANPTSGAPYTVLGTTPNARITSITVKVTWTVQPTPLEVHVTIDGIPTLFSFDNPVSGEVYFTLVASGGDALSQDLDTLATTGACTARLLIPFLLEGRSIKVEAETTGGTVQNLSARVKYARIP